MEQHAKTLPRHAPLGLTGALVRLRCMDMVCTLHETRSALCADRFSPPDASGIKYLILSRVLVGETRTGQSTYKSPQPKPAPRELENFESFADDEASPSIVVATRDFMAMPELILAFIDNANPAAASMWPSDTTYDFGVAI